VGAGAGAGASIGGVTGATGGSGGGAAGASPAPAGASPSPPRHAARSRLGRAPVFVAAADAAFFATTAPRPSVAAAAAAAEERTSASTGLEPATVVRRVRAFRLTRGCARLAAGSAPHSPRVSTSPARPARATTTT
jgi:hypothetical protein